MNVFQFFPTIVGHHNNKKFADDVLPIAKKILEGREKNYLNHTNTYSDEKINEYLNSIDFIREYISFVSHDYAENTGWIIQGETELMMFVSNMEKGDYMHSHTHPDSILSGICYLDCDEDSSPIIFEDSRDIRSFNGMVSKGELDPTKYNDLNNREVEFKPNNGDILIWESWMRHYVQKNKSDYRYTLVWNLHSKR